MSEHDALVAIRPRTRGDWKTLWTIVGYIALAVGVVIALYIHHLKHEERIAQTWQSATATIEDVRPVLVSHRESNFGGAMLYQLDVLVQYTADGAQQKRWMRIEQQPMSLTDTQLKIFRWKGQQCVVRWPASQPNHVIAEVN
jgi:hypothetical protein